MPRDIKFRGISKNTGKWIYGDLSKKHGNDGFYYTIETLLGEFSIVETESVGEYTGLKDKNGKEIYEGDILYELSFDGDAILCEVVFSNCAFMLKEWEIIDSFLYDSAKDMEVIGNVYENPELLNKKV
jgi:uncharacterized phage protein (TIGR01671 family)